MCDIKGLDAEWLQPSSNVFSSSRAIRSGVACGFARSIFSSSWLRMQTACGIDTGAEDADDRGLLKSLTELIDQILAPIKIVRDTDLLWQMHGIEGADDLSERFVGRRRVLAIDPKDLPSQDSAAAMRHEIDVETVTDLLDRVSVDRVVKPDLPAFLVPVFLGRLENIAEAAASSKASSSEASAISFLIEARNFRLSFCKKSRAREDDLVISLRRA